MRIGESAFEQVNVNRFRLILQGVELYYQKNGKIRGMKDGGECQRMNDQLNSIHGVRYAP